MDRLRWKLRKPFNLENRQKYQEKQQRVVFIESHQANVVKAHFFISGRNNVVYNLLIQIPSKAFQIRVHGEVYRFIDKNTLTADGLLYWKMPHINKYCLLFMPSYIFSQCNTVRLMVSIRCKIISHVWLLIKIIHCIDSPCLVKRSGQGGGFAFCSPKYIIYKK